MATLQTVLVALERRIPGAADHIDMVDAINVALSEVGHVTQVDETLTVSDNTTEYSLPSGVSNVVRVQVKNSASADYDYTTVYNWREVNGYLYLPDELSFDEGRTIRLYYNDTHDSVEDETDTISDDVPIPLLTAIAAYRYEYAQFYSEQNLGVKDQGILDRLQADMYAAQQRYRVNRMYRDPILGSEK